MNVFGVDLSNFWRCAFLLSAAALTTSSARRSTVSAWCVSTGGLRLSTSNSLVCTVTVIVVESADAFAVHVDTFVNANVAVVSALVRLSLGSEMASPRVPALMSNLNEPTCSSVASFDGVVATFKVSPVRTKPVVVSLTCFAALCVTAMQEPSGFVNSVALALIVVGVVVLGVVAGGLVAMIAASVSVASKVGVVVVALTLIMMV